MSVNELTVPEPRISHTGKLLPEDAEYLGKVLEVVDALNTHLHQLQERVGLGGHYIGELLQDIHDASLPPEKFPPDVLVECFNSGLEDYVDEMVDFRDLYKWKLDKETPPDV